MAAPDCPGEGVLRSVVDGSMDGSAFAAYEAHVGGCPSCLAVLERLVLRPDAFAGDLPVPGQWPVVSGYAIEAELAVGGMSRVYRATRHGLGRPVALKLLPGEEGRDGDDSPRRRWLREARATSSVRHPNVVPMLDCGEAGGRFYLVLDYMPGGTLKQRLGAPLPSRVAAGLMETIARAVAFIHACGFLHLDLKPSNVLLDCAPDAPWGQVVPRVADFGLALPDDGDGVSDQTRADVRGTPSYMAPEQADESAAVKIGAAADVYALGAVLYELLTGRPPFQGSTPAETREQARTRPPVPPRGLNAAVPRDLETVALKCLEKLPAHRYATAEAVADDLRRWLDGESIGARPVSPLVHGWRWCRRRPAVAGLGGALVLAVALGFVAPVSLWRQAEAERSKAEGLSHRFDEERGRAVEERGRATAEAVRAEARYRIARAALAEMLEVRRLRTAANDLSEPQVLGLLSTRGLIHDLVQAQPDDPVAWKLLATADILAFRTFFAQGKPAEVRFHATEALTYLEKLLHHDPADAFAFQHALEGGFQLARSVEQEGPPEVSLPHWERVANLFEHHPPASTEFELGSFAECQVALARLADRRGDPESAGRHLDAGLRALHDDPARGWAAGLAQYEHGMRVALAKLWERSLPREFEPLGAEEWARQVAGRLCPGQGYASRNVLDDCSILHRLLTTLKGNAASWRRPGQADEACRATERLRALARVAVARYPEPACVRLVTVEVLAARVAGRIGSFPPDASMPLIPTELPPEAWADRVLAALRSDAAERGGDDTWAPAVAWAAWPGFAALQVDQRKAERVDDARRLADQYLALARRLTQAYPGRADAHLFLSEAYVQTAKNAYRQKDGQVKEWTRLALAAAERAAALEPGNQIAQHFARDRRARLDRLIAR